MRFLVQVHALPGETENHYQLRKIQLFIENDLEGLYAGPGVSCPQHPNHPHDL